MNDEIREGGCKCGAVRFRTSGPSARAIACHCTTCKKRTGAAYGIGVYFEEKNVDVTQGELGVHEFHSDTSGRWIRNEFCTQCGTCLTWTLEMRPGMRAIAGGCYDDPHWFSIDAHIWTRSARPDMVYPDGMSIHEQALA